MGKRIKITELLDPDTFDQYKDELIAYFDKGGTWQELMGYDQGLMDRQYKIASDLYHQADYKNAAAVFSYLTTLNPYDYRFWMGLGFAKQSERLYEEAIVSYTAAGAIDPEQPLPYLHAAQCFYALQLKEMSLENLQKALEVAKSKPEHQETYRKAEILLNNFPK